ncbi:MAG TPA: M56 family metallopeptidase [Microbacteriaceae bacterium]|nr:M56 family metallopeptidase [Microbacteriaceae bacterium]
MSFTLGALAALAVALAWPVPMLLARARWTERSPRAALVMWQAIALGGALSMFSALLDLALKPSVRVADLAAAAVGGPLPADWTLLNALAFSAAVLFAVLLFANVTHAAWTTERKRRQHRFRVELLSDPLEGVRDVRLLNHPAPLAFCLPGLRNLTVLSSGLIELFDEGEFRAVIAHERAHLRGQHHLLLLAFRAWHAALPWFPIASRAEGAVARLIELVADDDAARTVPRADLARALERIGGAWEDGLSFGQDLGYAVTNNVEVRVGRLRAPRNRISVPARLLVAVTAFALVAVPSAHLIDTLGRNF